MPKSKLALARSNEVLGQRRQALTISTREELLQVIPGAIASALAVATMAFTVLFRWLKLSTGRLGFSGAHYRDVLIAYIVALSEIPVPVGVLINGGDKLTYTNPHNE